MKHDLHNKPLHQDQRSFYGSLYKSLYARLLKYGRSICNSDSLVEDAIQELFEKFMGSPKQYDHVRDIQAYLSTALRHSLYKKISHQSKINGWETAPELAAEHSAEFRTIQAETAAIQVKQVRAAISKLSVGEANVIRARFFEDKSYEDIALENNSTKRTVYNQIHSGIKKLRAMF